jgi:UDP:flavonoid glycosyltransferase YjiC (YdhE family)
MVRGGFVAFGVLYPLFRTNGRGTFLSAKNFSIAIGTPMADISVIHGGQNTVMNACLSGTPIVGVGMHPEQQANLDACVRKGFAIRLSTRKVTPSTVLDAVDRLLHDPGAQENVRTFQNELEKWEGPENAAKFLHETFGK